MAKFRLSCLSSEDQNDIQTREFQADRFNVYGQGRISFYVDHPTPGWINKHAVQTELVAEVLIHASFVVEKI